MNHGKSVIGIRLMLLRDYLQANAGKNRVVSRKQMETYLTEKGCPVEKKTLYADLAILESEFGMQLEYDPHKKGYLLLNPPFESHELRLLVDCVQAATFITQEEAAAITAKIKRLTDEENRALLNRPAVVMDRIQRIEDSVVRKADLIHQAIAENRKISFRYFRYIPNRGEHKKYIQADDVCDLFIINPRSLVWEQGTYYLERYRNDDYYHVYRFEVGRMTDIAILPDPRNCVEPPIVKQRQQELEAFFEKWGGKETLITIRFRNQAIQDVLTNFGPDTVIIPNGKYHFNITIKDKLNTEFYYQFSHCGAYAKILSPPEAVQGYTEYLENLLSMYTNNDEPLYVLEPEEFE